MGRMFTTTVPDHGFAVRWIELGGTGRPVAFLHGWGCSSASSFAEPARRLQRPSALIDLVGHGLSDRPQDFDYALPAHADAIASAVATFADEPVDLVGHSLGGTIALLVAERHPGLVHRAVLVEPAIDAFPVTASDFAALDEDDLRQGGFARHLAERETWDRRAEMRLADPIALRRIGLSLHDALGDTVHDILATPRVPTLLVIGGQRSYRAEDEIAAGGVEIVRLPAAGHFVMNDLPDAFAETVRRFLEGDG